MQRSVGVIVGLPLLVVLGLAAVATLSAWRAVPELSGAAHVNGLLAPLEILRDAHAIPHIYAHSANDAYFGLGYAHAQDRLWQMELARRVGTGSLAELIGQAALESDRLFRILGLEEISKTGESSLDADTRAALDAYCAGVNAWIDADRPLPIEFVVLGVKPRAWRPSDSLVVLKLMAWRLSGNWDAELWRLRLRAKLSDQQLKQLTTPKESDEPIAFDQFWRLYDQLKLQVVPAQRHARRTGSANGTMGEIAAELRRFAPSSFGRAVGSNNWATDGARTSSQRPLLANDPHLELMAPSQWYFAHLHASDLNVIGTSVPGLPGIILGRTDGVAWSVTNMLPDTQDLYFEKLEPKDGGYLSPKGPLAFEQHRERIHVRWSDAVELSVRRTRHGPVISDVSELAQRATPPGHVLSLRWVGLRSADQTVAFPLRAARAKNARDLLEAARSFESPAQNIVFADSAGTIGFVGAGRIPLRSAENSLRGLVPAPGWLAAYEWEGFVPFEELPQLWQPASGRIVTANQKPTLPEYPRWLGADWGPSYRYDRIATLLDARPAHSQHSFAMIQADLHSAIAEQLLPVMLAKLGAPSDARERAASDALRSWDRRMKAEGKEPLLFAAWLRELTRRICEDELAEAFPAEWEARPEFLAHVLDDQRAETRWCDDRRTPHQESCTEVTRAALRASLAYLQARFGEDPNVWSWGTAHVSVSHHLLFGDVPLLSSFFNLSGPRGGDSSTVDVGAYVWDDDQLAFENFFGPGFRAIYDLSAPDRSLGILNTGQSGHVLSPHYRDMHTRWLKGQHVPLVTERRALEREALGTWRLTPR